MGGKSSTFMQKVVSPVSQYMGYGETAADGGTGSAEGFGMPVRLANPFVLTRWSSMYMDEDGQVAHEFYVETPTRSKTKKGRRRLGMRRIYHNIQPQGEVPVDPPRLRVEIPAVMTELWRTGIRWYRRSELKRQLVLEMNTLLLPLTWSHVICVKSSNRGYNSLWWICAVAVRLDWNRFCSPLLSILIKD